MVHVLLSYDDNIHLESSLYTKNNVILNVLL
jgi:hypothetical protein